MNQFNTLQIHALPHPEVMERVLRVVRHRGFNLCALNMEQDCQHLLITITVDSVRPIQQLWSQLTKLVDVRQIDRVEMQQQPQLRALRG